ncbi:uncharacterized protein LOC129593032 [Paramacrobiotus metropolitanus]|uniref:uncharacterized protein LOC129593032 n=1 Tax=Paramacrobiotus metropolitanus TaxID=2943436 RepID=UPI0024457397|nr:uncharacterized protein LOC129593032 [Paramacrobiotus metropolitanus]
MKSTAAILTLWATVTLLLHYSAAQSENAPSNPGRAQSTLETAQLGRDSDKNPARSRRSSAFDILQTFWKCPDPLMTYGCRKCETSCANRNPPASCSYLCDSTCICKPGLYRTFIASPICAPPNGPLINNCLARPNQG